MRDANREGVFGLRFVAVVVVLAMAPTLAFAYIDPGNGAYMVQALFALMGAAFFYLRHPIRTLKSAWRWTLDRFKQSSEASEAADPAATAHPVVDETATANASLQERS
jgi:hypothetical protein